jgi:hypothetical protein
MHSYTHPITGGQLPSVTTILEDTMSLDRRALLDAWYANTAKSHLKNAESQRRGNQVDAWAKAYLLGRSYEIDWQFRPWCDRLLPMLEFIKAFADSVNVDEFVYTDYYAGTIDISYCYEGITTILDIKTRDRVFAEALESAQLQVAGYRMAKQAMGYRVGAICVLSVTPRQLHTTRIDEAVALQGFERQWQNRLCQFLGLGVECELSPTSSR